MRPEVSVHLDALRALAAFAVFVAHVGDYGVVAPELAAWVPEFGHDAVVVFFVLSGYVIAFTAGARHPDLGDYAAARAARLYSVALPVLLLTFARAAVGVGLAPDLYVDRYQLAKPALYVPFHLAFLGELWWLSEQPVANVPYWSLGYEAWYYLLFGLLAYYRGTARVLLGAACVLLMGFKLWLLLPIWLAGVLVHAVGDRGPPRPAAARALMGAVLAVYAGYKLSGLEPLLVELGNAPFGGLEATPLGSARHWLHDAWVGLLVAAYLYAMRHARLGIGARLGRGIRVAASFTFTLYLLHAPLLFFARAAVPYDRGDPLQVAALLAAVLAAVVGFGLCTEHRKGPYQRLFAALFARIGAALRGWPAIAFLLPPSPGRAR
jgi:peptidoglycan/LPS O-acetylase OafA/YrhL